MEFILRQVHKAGVFGWLYVLNLFLGFHFFSVHYIHSSYLSTFFTTTQVGILYTVSAALGLLMLGSVALFLTRYGNYQTALIAVSLDYLAVLGMATNNHPGIAAVLFGLHTLLVPVVLFSLDVFLERETKDESHTGNTRGIFLSVATLAALCAPALSGFLTGTDNEYQRVYMASALFLVPFIVILMWRFRGFVDQPYRLTSPFKTLLAVLHDGDLLHIGVCQFLMRFYFAWSVIYLPIYLHEHIGFGWPEIGTVLFLMLLPYILVEWPAGYLADRWLGEKELLVAGFVITVLATSALMFLSVPSVFVWGAVLFVTRVGMALIESMTETHFFKRVSADDTDKISFFRVLRPLAYVLGPLMATLVLAFTDLRHLWLVLAVIMLVGVWHAARLTDTK